jgi:hypothetical protein
LVKVARQHSPCYVRKISAAQKTKKMTLT